MSKFLRCEERTGSSTAVFKWAIFDDKLSFSTIVAKKTPEKRGKGRAVPSCNLLQTAPLGRLQSSKCINKNRTTIFRPHQADCSRSTLCGATTGPSCAAGVAGPGPP